MIDSANRDDADRQAAELALSLRQLKPWLTVYLRSVIGHRAAKCQDVEDIIQDTFLRVLSAHDRNPILHLRAYLMRVAKNCLSEHFQKKARQPKSLENLELFVDPYIHLPERAAQDREAYEQFRPAFLKYEALRPRFVNTLSDLDGQVVEFQDIREILSPLFESYHRTRKRTKGRPTKIEQVGLVLEELPGKIALLTEFFQEF